MGVKKKSSALRITNQFRSGGGMAYDLKCEGSPPNALDRERAGATDPGDWRIEARGSLSADDKANVVEWGHTRADALAAIGRVWLIAADTARLRVFDWDAVATALRAVRAL